MFKNIHLRHLLKSFGYTIPVADSLIALPLQGIPRKQGNSVFVDDEWNVLPDQWEYLSNRKCLTMDFVESKIQEWSSQQAAFTKADVGDEGGEISKPWEKKMALALEKSDVSEPLFIVLADCIYIPKNSVKPRTLNRIRKLATFSNQQFYKMQAMRYSTKQIPRVIQCFRELDRYVTLPRGCLDDLKEKLN